jgi:hypothetical protein
MRRAGSGLRRRLGHLSSRDRRALLLGGLVLLPALGWILLVRPWLGHLDDLRDRTEAERALLARERAVLAEAPTLPARLEETRVALEREQARLLHAPNLALAEAELARRLQGLSREHRVDLSEVRAVSLPPGISPPPGIQPLRLSLRGTSDFQGILEFVHAVEADPQLLQVLSMSMSPGDEGALSLLLVVQAHVSLHALEGGGVS